ncbi:MAG: ATP-binding protein [Sphaerochaetaceae bacterium]|nr:ATP-binding protein [Sphaerochaetaceae bacterium]
MEKKQNPFTIIFGVQPSSFIPRMQDFSEIISTFEADKPRTYSYLITGVRGSGKTVMLSHIQNYFSNKESWIVLRLNPDIDLFESAVSQLASALGSSKDLITEINVSLAGFGLGVSRRSVSDNETLLRKMLGMVKKTNRKVLIAIDEVTNTNNIKAFAHSYQAFIGELLPVYLLMTSLPENFSSLSESTNGTFLKRIPKIVLGRLNDTMIENEYVDIFNISHDEATALTKLVRGYPYAYQILGDLLWENDTKQINDKILRSFDANLNDCAYGIIWKSLSKVEKNICKAIANSSDGCVKGIRDSIGMTSNQFSPYRDSLLESGLVDGSEYGRLSFILPRFSEFVVQISKYE